MGGKSTTVRYCTPRDKSNYIIPGATLETLTLPTNNIFFLFVVAASLGQTKLLKRGKILNIILGGKVWEGVTILYITLYIIFLKRLVTVLK